MFKFGISMPMLSRLSAVTAVFGLFASVALPSHAQTPSPLRVMPVGDSITVGSGGTANLGGYRGTLYTLLQNAGYNPDFIGTQTNNSSSLTDQNHQGQGGWRIDQIDSNITAWFAAVDDPDVILLHIGTNDFGQSYNTPTAKDRLDALILKMATLRPHANIIVTNLMERGEPANTKIQDEFNPFVQDIVNAHAIDGRKVTFLDMRAAVPLADMPDNLHPNQTGYDKMAAAWLPAIQAVANPEGDTSPPAISRAEGGEDYTSVRILFSKPVADSAADETKYVIPGLTVASASLSADRRVVTLLTSAQAQGVEYTIIINGIVDRQAEPLPLPADSEVAFKSFVPRGYTANVPDSAGYTLIQSLELPVAASYGVTEPAYTVDNRALLSGYDRVAYYLELEKPDGTFDFVWVSMDAFTQNIYQLGVPTYSSGAIFELAATRMSVVSNVLGVAQGNDMMGSLEFWPSNYSAGANSGTSGSGSVYDFDDTRTASGTYGCMQVHNIGRVQTVFAINNWGPPTTGGNLDIGIGNQPNPENLTSVNPDWTFANNGAAYLKRTLHVLVRAQGDTEPPYLAAANASGDRTRIHVSFTETVIPSTVIPANFALDNGVQVVSATLAANRRDVVLVTTQQPAGTTLMLTVNGIRDSSPSANLIVPDSVMAVSPNTVPYEVSSLVGAAATTGYELVYTLDLPRTGNLISKGTAAYTWNDSASTTPFSRVAYYLELQKPGSNPEYVWVSMDAFTQDRKKLGVPTPASGAVFQQGVTNMQVVSNVAGVTGGSGIATGNIEFWPTDYAVENGNAIPNASDTNYDFGDTRRTTGSFGSMQVHNHGASQTVFGINHWGADGSVLDLGIGNNPGAGTGKDWTNAANAGLYFKRRLHVLVLPAAPVLPAEVAANVPEAQGYQLVYSLNIPEQGNLTAPAYTVNKGAQMGPFSRIAYYMQLQTGTAEPEFVWVSMDAFTTDASKIGVPTAASAAVHQRRVNRMNVVSNKAGIVTGTDIATGNIEFWPTNYTAAISQSFPGGSATLFDFDDTRGTTGTYGSMQVHNHGAGQTLFALNNWGNSTSTTNRFGLGIGNCPTPVNGGLDWTHTTNSNTYSSRLLHVFVLPGDPDVAPPVPLFASASTQLDRLTVTFNEAVAASSVLPENFVISGLEVTAASLLPGGSEVLLRTSAQTAGTDYLVQISGVQDVSARANAMTAPVDMAFKAYQPPALLASIPEAAGYEMIYQVALPVARPQWNLNPVSYAVNEAVHGEKLFDRVAYLLELDGNWVFASFDRHTDQLRRIGIPTASVTSTPFQQQVSNLVVNSNVESIVKGSFATGGNIEFWNGNYGVANSLNIPNASATVYDWGDSMSAGAHACMQVHNHAQQQILFAYNNWGSNSGTTSDLGIGNNPAPVSNGVDWTFAANTNSYTTRNLYVLARPSAQPPTEGGPVIVVQPGDRSVYPGQSVTLSVTLLDYTGVSYQWRYEGEPIPGATEPWLDLPAILREARGTYDVVLTGANLATTVSEAAEVDVFNHPPVFEGYRFAARTSTPALLSAQDLVLRATDEEGDALQLSLVQGSTAQGGTVSLNGGVLTYVSAADFRGADSFSIRISDPFDGEVIAQVQVSVTGVSLAEGESSALVRQPSGVVEVAFRGVPGQAYEIQRSASLEEASWQPVGTETAGDDGVIAGLDPEAGTDRMFYRIVPAGGAQ